MILASLTNILAIFMTFFAKNLAMLYIIYYIFGLSFSGNVSISSLYSMEFINKRYRIRNFCIMNSLSGSCVGFMVFYFLVISKNYIYFLYIELASQSILLAGVLWLPESPDFLFSKGRYEESKAVILKIAKFNKREISEDQISFFNVEDQANKI